MHGKSVMLEPSQKICLADKGKSIGPKVLTRLVSAIATVKLMTAGRSTLKGGLSSGL